VASASRMIDQYPPIFTHRRLALLPLTVTFATVGPGTGTGFPNDHCCAVLACRQGSTVRSPAGRISVRQPPMPEELLLPCSERAMVFTTYCQVWLAAPCRHFCMQRLPSPEQPSTPVMQRPGSLHERISPVIAEKLNSW